MITNDKVTEIFCIIDEFCKNLDAELVKTFRLLPQTMGTNAFATARDVCRTARL